MRVKTSQTEIKPETLSHYLVYDYHDQSGTQFTKEIHRSYTLKKWVKQFAKKTIKIAASRWCHHMFTNQTANFYSNFLHRISAISFE